MPLLSPSQIHQVLNKDQNLKLHSTEGRSNLQKLLHDNNLTPDEVLMNLSSMMRGAESDSTRLRAAETALKLNGLLDTDVEKNNFSVTIIINDSQFGTNPILIPR